MQGGAKQLYYKVCPMAAPTAAARRTVSTQLWRPGPSGAPSERRGGSVVLASVLAAQAERPAARRTVVAAMGHGDA